jgi:hypothetical protein
MDDSAMEKVLSFALSVVGAPTCHAARVEGAL